MSLENGNNLSGENFADLDKRLTLLEGFREQLFQVGQQVFAPSGIGLLMSDLFIIGILKKSLSITFGFSSLMREKNYIAAAPLVRIHIDTLLRMHALYLAPNRTEFTKQIVFDRKSIRDMKSNEGKLMTDGYLVRHLTASHLPWLKPLYDKMCGFVHLSDEHVWAAARLEANILTGVIGSEDYYVPFEEKTKAVNAMIGISEVLNHHLLQYAKGKEENS